MLGGVSNISIPSINNVVVQGGRMTLPVDSSALIYSHFRHVSGVPAPEGINGVSISKLNLLDVLIGQLNQIRKNGTPISAASREAINAALNPAQLDALIETYREQIQQARASSAAMPYIHAPSAHSGAVFSLSI